VETEELENKIEETEVEEVNVMSLLTEQSGEVEDEVTDEVPDTIEGLKEALENERAIKTKRNKSLKKSKQATHRFQEENDALLKRLDEIEGRLGTSQPNPEVAKLEQVAQEKRDRAIDNPEEIPEYIDYMQRQSETRIATFLAEKFAGIEQSINGLQQGTDPEVLKYKTQMDSLRETEEFRDLDDVSLLAVTKALSGKTVKKPRGVIAGGKPFTNKDGKFEMTDELRISMGFEPRGE